MFDYYIYYFGPNKTKPALYRVHKTNTKVTYAEYPSKNLIFYISAISAFDILSNPKDFIKLK